MVKKTSKTGDNKSTFLLMTGVVGWIKERLVEKKEPTWKISRARKRRKSIPHFPGKLLSNVAQPPEEVLHLRGSVTAAELGSFSRDNHRVCFYRWCSASSDIYFFVWIEWLFFFFLMNPCTHIKPREKIDRNGTKVTKWTLPLWLLTFPEHSQILFSSWINSL